MLAVVARWARPAGGGGATGARWARGATGGRGFVGGPGVGIMAANMIRLTLGYHLVLSGYGLWLPGDERGHWSEKWDQQLGLIEPGVLHEGDPIRKRMAEERMTHAPVRLDRSMMDAVVETLSRCGAESDWKIAAGSIEQTHTHLLLTYTTRDIDDTVKWLKDRMTKAIHRSTSHKGPVWCKGKWRSFIFDDDHWRNALGYIERHNIRRGLEPRPYPFITVCA